MKDENEDDGGVQKGNAAGYMAQKTRDLTVESVQKIFNAMTGSRRLSDGGVDS